jgi:excisionase family DNA binding protein
LDCLGISGGLYDPRPPGATPYKAEHAPDRAVIGRSGDRVALPERLLTVREVAARLGVCRATVYAMVERGELPHVRISGAVRVHPTDLMAFVVRLLR